MYTNQFIVFVTEITNIMYNTYLWRIALMCNFIAFASKCNPEVSFFKLTVKVEIRMRTVPCDDITSKPVLSGAIKTSKNVKTSFI